LKRDDENLIPLSALQHIVFCPRQFALIHVEQVWRENVLTAQGRIIHDKAHDPFFTEKRGDLITTRAVPLVSHELGITGEADVVEWRCGDTGVPLKGRDRLWSPMPVEYKRGKPKKGAHDEVQLCAQVMCLEEMLGVNIEKGALYYWEIRSRVEIVMDDPLRGQVKSAAVKAHEIIASGTLPPPDRPKSRCQRCSLVNECMPASKSRKSASTFVQTQLKEAGI
jgi:CRISPR-associated exonuclease Cas4